MTPSAEASTTDLTELDGKLAGANACWARAQAEAEELRRYPMRVLVNSGPEPTPAEIRPVESEPCAKPGHARPTAAVPSAVPIDNGAHNWGLWERNFIHGCEDLVYHHRYCQDDDCIESEDQGYEYALWRSTFNVSGGELIAAGPDRAAVPVLPAEPTDAMVEAAAKERQGQTLAAAHGAIWVSLSAREQDAYRADVRAILRAALAAGDPR
jgi:hypothetical protein